MSVDSVENFNAIMNFSCMIVKQNIANPNGINGSIMRKIKSCVVSSLYDMSSVRNSRLYHGYNLQKPKRSLMLNTLDIYLNNVTCNSKPKCWHQENQSSTFILKSSVLGPSKLFATRHQQGVSDWLLQL